MSDKAPESQAPQVSWTHWVIATLIAAFSMIGYVHQFVYTRAEGEKLELRVKTVEENGRNDMELLRGKIDKVYELLLSLKRARRDD